jgi:hypothetical protein
MFVSCISPFPTADPGAGSGPLLSGPAMAASPVDHLPPPWRVALRLAWEAHCTGNIGVGAVLTDPAGRVVGAGPDPRGDATPPPAPPRAPNHAPPPNDARGHQPPGA